ncbi:MAG: oligosaccharide flippase family protein [Minisyncoccia bacterium]
MTMISRNAVRQMVRRGGDILKTDLGYLLRGGGWLSLGQIAASGSSLLLALLFANLLPKETFGTYKYILSLVSIFGLSTLVGINTSLAQGIAKGNGGSFLPAIRTKIRWGFVGSVISLGIAAYYYINGNSELAFLIALISLFIPIMDPMGLYSVYLQSKKLFRESTIYFLISQSIAFASMATTLLITENVVFIVLAYFIPWTLTRSIFHFLTLKKFPPESQQDPSIISKGKHLSIIGIATNVATYCDSLIIFHFLGPASVARYAIAIAPVENLRAAYKNIIPLALPKLSNRSISEINTLLYKRLLLLFGLGIGTAAAYALIAPFAFHLLFPKYLDAIFISQIFAFTIAFKLPGTFFSAATQSKIDLIPKSWLYWSSVPQFVLLLSMLILTPLYGLFGVLLSKFLEQIVGFGVGFTQWILLSKRHRL